MLDLPKIDYDMSHAHTHEEARETIHKILQDIYNTTQSHMNDIILSQVDDCGGDVVDALSSLYWEYRDQRSVKREKSGVVVDHGIVNAISDGNVRAHNVVRNGDYVAGDIGLVADGRGGRYANDFYFETCVVDEMSNIPFTSVWVLNSKRVKKLVNLYEKLADDTTRIPSHVRA